MDSLQWRRILKSIWRFIWEDDSILSWIINIVLAFILIKFVVYPVLGFLLATKFPVVAVISSSMEHDGNFETWWAEQQDWYEARNITIEEFVEYPWKNGFNKGDIMVLYGTKAENIKEGHIIVFSTTIRKEPIIHRVVEIDGGSTFTTKGDHNAQTYEFERQIQKENLLGRAVFRIPYLGYIKIWFVDLLHIIGIM